MLRRTSGVTISRPSADTSPATFGRDRIAIRPPPPPRTAAPARTVPRPPTVTAARVEAAVPVQAPAGHRVARVRVTLTALRTPLRVELDAAIMGGRRRLRPRSSTLRVAERGPIARGMLRVACTKLGAELGIDMAQIPVVRVDRHVRRRTRRPPTKELLAGPHALRKTLPLRLVDRALTVVRGLAAAPRHQALPNPSGEDSRR